MLHPVREIEVLGQDDQRCELHLASLLGEHPLTEQVDIDDIPLGSASKGLPIFSHGRGSRCTGRDLRCWAGRAAKRDRWCCGRSVCEDGLGASEYEADDLGWKNKTLAWPMYNLVG